MAGSAAEWRFTGMHIDDHSNFVRDWRAAARIDRGGDDDVTGKIFFKVAFAFAFKHLAEIDMGEDTVALRLRALPEFSMGTLADEFPQLGELPGFGITSPGLPGAAAPVIHPFIVRADGDPGRHDVGFQQFHKFQRWNGGNDRGQSLAAGHRF